MIVGCYLHPSAVLNPSLNDLFYISRIKEFCKSNSVKIIIIDHYVKYHDGDALDESRLKNAAAKLASDMDCEVYLQSELHQRPGFHENFYKTYVAGVQMKIRRSGTRSITAILLKASEYTFLGVNLMIDVRKDDTEYTNEHVKKLMAVQNKDINLISVPQLASQEVYLSDTKQAITEKLKRLHQAEVLDILNFVEPSATITTKKDLKTAALEKIADFIEHNRSEEPLNINLKRSVEIAKALSSETRIQILKMLAGGKMRLNEISHTLDMSSPSSLEHLRTLTDLELVRTVQVNGSKYYTLANRNLNLLINFEAA